MKKTSKYSGGIAAAFVVVFILYLLFANAGYGWKAVDGNPLRALSSGKINGVAYGIGTECKVMLNEIGEPDSTGTIYGNFYYIYGKVTYFSNSLDKGEGNICAIAVRDKIDICGVRVGMAVPDIKRMLGRPLEEGYDEGGNWVMTYEVKKDLYLCFFSKSKDLTADSALLILKDQ